MSQSQACAEIKMPFVQESSNITNKDRLIGIIKVVFMLTHFVARTNIEYNRLYPSPLVLL